MRIEKMAQLKTSNQEPFSMGLIEQTQRRKASAYPGSGFGERLRVGKRNERESVQRGDGEKGVFGKLVL